MSNLPTRQDILRKIQDDPFYYGFIAVGADHLFEASRLYPNHFTAEDASKVLSVYMNATADKLENVDCDEWLRGLRNLALQKLAKLCNVCEKCPLHKNRISGRGAVFGEGSPDAEMMVVGEGPGNYESRVGFPFTDSYSIRASTCATKCSHFEECYIDPKDPEYYNKFPKRRCEYDPVEISQSQLRERVRSRKNTPYTTGEGLNKELRASRFLRSSYVQVLKMHNDLGLSDPPRDLKKTPANIYLTNAVRCWSYREVDGKIENCSPAGEHIETCRPWLELTIYFVNPKVILAVGNPGLSALQAKLPPHWKITEACKTSREDPEIVEITNSRRAYVTLHPSFIMREQNIDIQNSYWEKMGRTLKSIAAELAQK